MWKKCSYDEIIICNQNNCDSCSICNKYCKVKSKTKSLIDKILDFFK